MASAIYLMSTLDHLNKNIDQLIILNNEIKNFDVYILFLDELNSIHDKTTILDRLSFITPEEIGIKPLDLKRLLFECTVSELNSNIFPFIVHYLDDHQYPLIIYIGYQIKFTKRHIHLIQALGNSLVFDKIINKIRINIINEGEHEYFYNCYSDKQSILRSDREKFINMHELEKEILGDPFVAKNTIKNIKKIVCAREPFQARFEIDHKKEDLSGLKKHTSQIDYMFSVLRWYQVLILVVYILFKVSKKFIIKFIRIARTHYRMGKAT